MERRKCILLVSSDQNFKRTFGSILQEHGCTAVCAIDIVEADLALSQIGFDLLILDDCSPSQRALSWLKEARHLGLDMPVCYLGEGPLDPFDFISKESGLGIATMVTKPVSPSRLLEHVRSALESGQAEDPPGMRYLRHLEEFSRQLPELLAETDQAISSFKRNRDGFSNWRQAKAAVRKLKAKATTFDQSEIADCMTRIELVLDEICDSGEKPASWIVIELCLLKCHVLSGSDHGGHQQSPSADLSDPETRKLEVVVVDSNPATLRRLSAMLYLDGMKVHPVASQKALDGVMSRLRPDLVLLSSQATTPAMLELCQAIGAWPDWSDTPVLIIAGDRSGIHRENIDSTVVYLDKPIFHSELLSMIRQHAQKERLRRETALAA